MNIEEEIEIQDCPLCDGAASFEEESGSGFYVMCMDCGCRTVTIDFKSDADKKQAALRAADLWNTGKVISSHPGE